MHPSFVAMIETFQHALLVDRQRVDAILRGVGDALTSGPEGDDARHRVQFVSLFIRRIQGVSVEESFTLERALLRHCGALEAEPARIDVATAIDVVTLRTVVRHLSMSTSMTWEGSQRIQALAANVARAIRQEDVALEFRGGVLGERMLLSFVVPSLQVLERSQVAVAFDALRAACVGFRVVNLDGRVAVRAGCDAVSVTARRPRSERPS